MTPNDVKIVADNIDDFIEVPNGIEKLRQAVLTLAVSGKIVPQVKSEKITEGINESSNTKIPFDIPKSWKWVDFAEVFDIHGGTQPPKKDFIYEPKQGYVRLLQIRDFGERGVPTYVRVESVRRFCKPEDVLIGRYGASVGRICSGMEGAYNVALAKVDFLHSSLEREYAKIYFLQDYFQSKLLAISRSAQAGFNKEDLSKFVFPYPPVTEQKRIVKKVREVMKQLDELEAKKRERDEVRTRLARSAMQSLGRGDSRIAFEELTELVKTPSDIKELENALLTLAVSGKLVAQDKKDTAVEGERATIEYGKEFNIPKSWAWFRLNDVCTFKYGYTDSAKETGTARFVRITDMGSDGNLIPDDQRYVDLSPESKKYLLSEGDLLTARIGATFGRTIIFREKYKAVFASYLIRMSFEKDFILSEYYWVFSQSGLYWDQAHSLVSGSAQPQFNANLIKKIYLPVPPLAEQKRIVKKVEEVMVLINRLKQVIGEK